MDVQRDYKTKTPSDKKVSEQLHNLSSYLLFADAVNSSAAFQEQVTLSEVWLWLNLR